MQMVDTHKDNAPWLALRASAGSGKTFALTLRYIALLLKGARAREILALTFTNKAAAEMADRVQKALQILQAESQAYHQWIKEDSPSDFTPTDPLIQALKDGYGISLANIASHVDKIYQHFLQDRPQITTIDAFLQKVLRKFSYYVGVSAQFQVGHLDNKDKLNAFISTLNHNDQRRLQRLCTSLLDFSDSNMAIRALEPMLKLYYEGVNAMHLNAPFTQDIKSLEEAILNQAGTLKKKVLKRVEGQRAQRAIKDSSLKELLGSAKPILEGSDYVYFRKFHLQDLDPEFQALQGQIRLYYQAKEALVFQELAYFLELYHRHNHNPSRLDFATIALETHKLLSHKKWENDFSHFFYFRLDAQISHILIDEFQDTSILQYEILRPLIDEIRAGKGQKERLKDRSVFFVGDAKQGIYGFRGSYGALFDRICDQIPTRSLPYNFRSSACVLDFVNTAFSKVEKFDYTPQHLFDPSKHAGYVKVIEPQAEPRDILNAVLKEVRDLLQRGINPHAITLLCFKNDNVNTLRDYLLEAREDDELLRGIEVVSETDMSLLAQREVKIIVHALKHALAPQKHKPYYQACMAKLLGLDLEASLVLPPFKEDLGAYVFALMQGLQLYSPSACRLLELCFGHSDAQEFLESLEKENPSFSHTSTQGLRIMTIHKSKGMEFNHVILMDRLGDERPNTDKFFITYDDHMHVFYKQKHRESFDCAYKQAFEDDKNTQEREKIHVLYVACTRAKHSLVVIAKDQKSALNPPLKLKPLITGDLSSSVQACQHEQKRQEQERQEQEERAKQYGLQEVQISLLESQSAFGTQDDHLRLEAGEKQTLQEGNVAAMLFGIVLHKGLEFYYGYGVDLQSLRAYLEHHYGFKGVEVAQVLERLEGLQTERAFLELLEGRIAVEVGFKHHREIFRMDMLVAREDQIMVLDYKSGTTYQNEHMTQVKNYVERVRSACPHARVQGVLIYALQAHIEVHHI